MKRNLDLLRNILIAIEESENFPQAFDNIAHLSKALNYTDLNTISYHISLLADCNYIEYIKFETIGPSYVDYAIIRLTSQGHDFLDNIRNDTVWNKTQEELQKYGEGAALEIVKLIAGKIFLRLTGF